MKRYLNEQSAIFTSVFKWVLLSSIVGSIIGLLISLFLFLIHTAENHREDLGFAYYYTLPFAFLLSVWVVKKFAPTASGHGTEKVIEAVHKNSGKIDIKVMPIKVVATIITIFSGGSVGKEGPGAQIGASFASFFSALFSFNDRDRKKLVICGISAGFASVFGTPIAGAIFGVEVLFVGAIMYDVLLPSIIAGFAAFSVAHFFGVSYTYYDVMFYKEISLEFGMVFKVIVAGVFFGFVANLFINILRYTNVLLKRYLPNIYFRAFLAGTTLLLLATFFSDTYLGLGLNLIENALENSEHTRWYDFLAKSLYTALSLGGGGSGGVITPIFSVGASSGHLFGVVFGGEEYILMFTAIGFVSVIAGATNTPLAAIIMAVELFGLDMAHYAALSIVIAFLLSGHKSVFSSQKLAMKKSEYLDIKEGEDIEHVEIKKNVELNEEMHKIKDIRVRRRYKKMLVKLKHRMEKHEKF